ncbi:hypothetical protein N7931_11115 [Catenovulum sp. 2E275]|uniref:hypothetical protein n=1 Tax=Catenovulum sp. 2E275 TaxID=2980497 RepID=UPI0021D3CCF2|nr:hypothetical protein [Catenovulum sp. 2E275]MCU4676180.1 hypothetical protein [Catenovulum sp. 2E275]
MRIKNRYWLIFIFSIILAACGGGSSLERANDTDDTDTGDTSSYTITAQSYLCTSRNLTEVSDIQAQCAQTNIVNQPQPLYFVVSVKNAQTGNAVSNQLVSASAGTGVLFPENGNAITNNSGQAIFKVFSSGATGSAQLSVSYDDESNNFVYQINTNQVTPTHGYQLNAQLTNVSGEAITQVSDAQPGVVRITLDYEEADVASQLISVSSTLGLLSPASGKVLTDENGVAQLTLNAGNVESSGILTIETEVINGVNTLNLTKTIAFSSAGDSDTTTSGSQTLSLALFNSDLTSEIYNISQAQPGILRAELTDQNGEAITRKVVTFSSNIGELFPEIGTALTDDSGYAYVDISAGSVRGAGTVMASYNNSTTSLSFTSEGDENLSSEAYDITVNFYQCDEINATRFDIANCLSVPVGAVPNDGIIEVKLTRESSSVAVANKIVNASLSSGALSPSSGRALTDENGLAYFSLLASNESGARTLTVSANNSSEAVDFSIIAPNLLMGSYDANGDFVAKQIASNLTGELAIGSTAVFTINLINDEDMTAYTQPVNVSFTSACVEAGTAFIDSSVIAINGQATAIYRSDNCKGSDVISASANIGNRSLNASTTISLAESTASYIKFIEASIDGDNQAYQLSYPDTGLPAQAEMIFQVLGNDNNPKANQNVRFTLTAQGSGIEITPTQAVSDSNGQVYLTVKSGRAPTPVLIIAELLDADGNIYNPRIQAVSRRLSVSSGLADQNSVSLSLDGVNIEAWNIDGVENQVTMRMADHFNNPVPNGTAVNFIASGGMIEPSCLTQNGACSVNWTSQSPRPMNNNLLSGRCDVGNDNNTANDIDVTPGQPCYGLNQNGVQGPLQLARPRSGRVNILAFAVGEESFVDSNGNGFYDANEKFGDLSEAFLDFNEDNQFCGRLADGSAAPGALAVNDPLCLAGGDDDEPVDFNNDGSFNQGNNLFDGILCQDGQNCTQNFVHIRDSGIVVLSGSTAYFTVREADGSQVNTVDLVANPFVSFTAYITDINNNPIAVGSSIELSIDNGEISGSSSYEMPKTSTSVPFGFGFTIKREIDPNGSATGVGTITVTSPSGVVSSYTFSIVDAG